MYLSKTQIKEIVRKTILSNDSVSCLMNENQLSEIVESLTKEISDIQHSYKCLIDEQLNVIKRLNTNKPYLE